MVRSVVALLSGVIFGVGLIVSGMTQPHKVVGFLDIFRDWDPTLNFVMIGAILVNFIAYLIVKKRRAPIFAAKFNLPKKKDLDKRLIFGAALFGIGWGIGGFCPGPAITSAATLKPEVLFFIFAMFFGMVIGNVVNKKLG